jgi:hypothetical protein
LLSELYFLVFLFNVANRRASMKIDLMHLVFALTLPLQISIRFSKSILISMSFKFIRQVKAVHVPQVFTSIGKLEVDQVLRPVASSRQPRRVLCVLSTDVSAILDVCVGAERLTLRMLWLWVIRVARFVPNWIGITLVVGEIRFLATSRQWHFHIVRVAATAVIVSIAS